MKLTISNASYLACATHFMAVNDIRHYLNGLHIQVHLKGVRVEATNGHVLARLDLVDDFTVIEGDVPPDSIVNLPKACISELRRVGNKGKDVTLTYDGDEVRLRIAGSKVIHVCDLVDGTFPDADKVIPKYKESGPVAPAIDSKYVGAFVTAAKCFDLECPATTLTYGPAPDHEGDAGSAVLVHYPTVSEFTGVLMPMRV
jgi:hypothetical protein